MSCYEWERGTIKLPVRDFAGFRRGLVEFYNKRQGQLLARAKEIHAQVAAEAKGKRGFDYREAVLRRVAQTWDTDAEGIAAALLRTEPGKPAQLRSPLAKQFSPLKYSATLIRRDDAAITFDAEKKSVTWWVDENNHACERAHEDPVAREFFARLGRVNWVRGTGGEIVGNDEYNRDNESAGGGGNYVKERFGPEAHNSGAGLGRGRF